VDPQLVSSHLEDQISHSRRGYVWITEQDLYSQSVDEGGESKGEILGVY
jgi:hypothetical protein